MFKIAVMACGSAIAAIVAAKAVLLAGEPVPAAAAAQPSSAGPALRPAAEPASQDPASIAKAADGHFWAEATVNSSHVRFLVDTGATAVALTRNDATRLGLTPASLRYDYKVMTANGETRAARVTLASVAVAGARVNDVEAYVIEDGLDASLLGMSYLGRLNRFEATQNTLILRP